MRSQPQNVAAQAQRFVGGGEVAGGGADPQMAVILDRSLHLGFWGMLGFGLITAGVAMMIPVRELDTLPQEIEALEHEQQALVARMSSADYHKRGADAIKADRKRAADLEHLLAAKFERWSALDQKIASGNG